MDNTTEQYTILKANFHAWLHQQKEEVTNYLRGADHLRYKLQDEFEEPDLPDTPRNISNCHVASLSEKTNLVIWRMGLLTMAHKRWSERYDLLSKAIEGDQKRVALLYDEFRLADEEHNAAHAAMLQEMILGLREEKPEGVR